MSFIGIVTSLCHLSPKLQLFQEGFQGESWTDGRQPSLIGTIWYVLHTFIYAYDQQNTQHEGKMSIGIKNKQID